MSIYYTGQDGSVKVLGDNVIVHYNKNHDSLGRFSGSGSSVSIRSPGQIQRDLNKTDYKISKAFSQREDLSKASERSKNRIKKAKNDKQLNRRLEKDKKINDSIKAKEAIMREGMKQTNKYVSEAKKNGYTLKTKRIERCVNKGEVAAQMAIAAPFLATGVVPIAVITSKHVSGTKYKVRKPKQ